MLAFASSCSNRYPLHLVRLALGEVVLVVLPECLASHLEALAESGRALHHCSCMVAANKSPRVHVLSDLLSLLPVVLLHDDLLLVLVLLHHRPQGLALNLV